MDITLCMLGNFSCFSARLLMVFFQIYLFKKFFQKHYPRVKQFRSRSGQMFCPSWSWSKLFERLSADDKSQRYLGKSYALWTLLNSDRPKGPILNAGSKCTKMVKRTPIWPYVVIPANMEVCLCDNDQLLPRGAVQYLQCVISVYKLK